MKYGQNNCVIESRVQEIDMNNLINSNKVNIFYS